jgi:hypothetical protein
VAVAAVLVSAPAEEAEAVVEEAVEEEVAAVAVAVAVSVPALDPQR